MQTCTRAFILCPSFIPSSDGAKQRWGLAQVRLSPVTRWLGFPLSNSIHTMEVAYFEFRIVLLVQVMATLFIDRAVYEASDACTMRLLFWCNVISSYILWQWFISDIHTLSNDIVILMYNYITLRTCRPRGEIRITSIVFFFCFSAVTWIVYSQTDDTAISTETVERNLLLRAILFAVRQSWAYVALQTRCQNLL